MQTVDTIYTKDVAETEQCGAFLAREFASRENLPRFVALYGDLGVGKTAFVRGFASVIAPSAIVRSPTFALVNEYSSNPLSLFHFDMYRIDSEDDLLSIGYDDYLTRRGICLVEWSEKIPYAIPDELIRVTIEKLPDQGADARRITIEVITEDKL